MSESKSASSLGGVGVLGLLGVLFIGLKLTGYIDWSWLWVLAPFWIGPAVVLGLFGAGLMLLVAAKVKDILDGNR